MECVFCKTDNRENAIFCKNCGKQIELKCPLCQGSVPPDSKYCDHCGGSIESEFHIETVPLNKEGGLVEWVRDILNAHTSANLFESCSEKLAIILIKEALKVTGGNRSQAARLLGLSRPTLHSKLEKFSID